jgi:hypothetical protein
MTKTFSCKNIEFRSRNQLIFSLISCYFSLKKKHPEDAANIAEILFHHLPQDDYDLLMDNGEIPISYLGA